MFQAYGNAQHYQQLQQDLSQLQQSLNPLGLVILNTEGQVQFVTPQAVVWLEAYFAKPTGTLQLPRPFVGVGQASSHDRSKPRLAKSMFAVTGRTG